MPALYSLNTTQNQKRTLNKSTLVEKFNATESAGATLRIAGVSRSFVGQGKRRGT
ncbi:MAG: hypothetical protein WCA00_21520 [Candidatus Acidiferrales bacterium]